jgi:DNA-binding LacI/PurR family transcriptional regulator
MSIKQIAEDVGVSVSTVSRVLNNPEYRCQVPGLRDKIWDAAMSRNYVPNEAARNLRTGAAAAETRTYSIHILVTRMDSESTDPFFRELLRVVESEIHRHGCILSKVWYRSLFSDDKRCKRADIGTIVEHMREETDGVGDGLIIIGKCNQLALQKLNRCYRGTVYVNRDSSLGEMDEVVCNGQKMASSAVKYLIGLGHENIGYVGSCHNEARYKGYIDTLRENGLDVDASYVIETRQTEKEGFEAMKRFLDSGKCPTGIYCSNDITAIGMLKYLSKHRNRYYMPSIISSDGIDEVQYTTPMLTTVQVSREEMGKFAMYLLLDRLRGGHSGNVKIELECRLVKRDSCTPVEESKWCDYYI